MNYHAEKYFKFSNNIDPPDQAEIDRALYVMEQAYACCVYDLPDDFDSYESFLRSLRKVENTSSPGYPYMLEASTNGEWLDFDGVWYSEDKVLRLWNDVLQYLNGNFPVIFTVFVKTEPHKLSKVKDDRWRLIIASPLCVQMAWHMIFDYLNDIEVERSYDIPSKQGIKIVNGGWKQYMLIWKNLGFNVGLDKEAWDWTMPWFKLRADLDFRRRLTRGRRIDDWFEYAKKLYHDMFYDPCLVLSNGRIYKQMYPGIMKSGCVNTISTNSHCQVLDHILVSFRCGTPVYPLPHACGDDTLQRAEQVADVNEYIRISTLVKSASDGLEFVGHDFIDQGPQPLYVSKHFVKLLTVPDDNLLPYFDSMMRMYCHSTMFRHWEYLARLLNLHLELKTREYYLTWYDFDLD